MSWREIYESRKCTADEAVKLIKSNDNVILGHCICEPTGLVDAMVANYENYENVTVAHMVSLGKGEYTKPELKKRPWKELLPKALLAIIRYSASKTIETLALTLSLEACTSVLAPVASSAMTAFL